MKITHDPSWTNQTTKDAEKSLHMTSVVEMKQASPNKRAQTYIAQDGQKGLDKARVVEFKRWDGVLILQQHHKVLQRTLHLLAPCHLTIWGLQHARRARHKVDTQYSGEHCKIPLSRLPYNQGEKVSKEPAFGFIFNSDSSLHQWWLEGLCVGNSIRLVRFYVGYLSSAN